MISLYEYNRVDPVIETFITCINDLQYRFYVSDILHRLISSPDYDPDFLVKKAMAILKITGLPVQEHIRCVYRSDSSGIRRDWRLSELAGMLIILSYKNPDAEIEELQNMIVDHYSRQ